MENDPLQQAQPQPPTPSKKRPRLIASLLLVLVVAVLIILSLVLFHTSNTTNKTRNEATATIQITSQGFEPATLKVRVGTKVVWNNTDSALHQIASNPYPANNSLSSLASPGLEPGKSYSYTFKQAGKFGYHDQQNPTHVLGVINVAE